MNREQNIGTGKHDQTTQSDSLIFISTDQLIGRMNVDVANATTAVESVRFDGAGGGQGFMLSVSEVFSFSSTVALAEFFVFQEAGLFLDNVFEGLS